VKAGDYTLAIAIADKDTNEPAMNLAIEGGREDGRYPLYTLTVSKQSGTSTGGFVSGITDAIENIVDAITGFVSQNNVAESVNEEAAADVEEQSVDYTELDDEETPLVNGENESDSNETVNEEPAIVATAETGSAAWLISAGAVLVLAAGMYVAYKKGLLKKGER